MEFQRIVPHPQVRVIDIPDFSPGALRHPSDPGQRPIHASPSSELRKRVIIQTPEGSVEHMH
jgi:hypothetical protein